MLNAHEQGVLRKHAEHALIDRCAIQVPTIVSDNAGGTTTVWDTLVEDVPCRLSPVRNDFEQERQIAERLGASVSWILSVPVGTNIDLQDRILIELSAGGYYEFPMEVQAVLTVPRSIATVTRVVVIETR